MGDDNSNQHLEQQIFRYFNQLTQGCGKNDCKNINCATSSRFQHKNIDRNRAAVIAIQNMQQHKPLCNNSTGDCSPEPAPAHNFLQAMSSTSENVDAVRPAPRFPRRLDPSSSSISIRPIATNYCEASTSPERLVPTASSTEDGAASAESAADDDRVRGISSNLQSISPGLSRFLQQVSSSSPHRDTLNHLSTASSDNFTNLQDFADIHALNSTITNEEASLRQFVERLSSTTSNFTSQKNPITSFRVHGLTLIELTECIESCRAIGDGWSKLIHLLEDVFSSLPALAASFPSSAVAYKRAVSKHLKRKPSIKKEVNSDIDTSDCDSTARNDDVEMPSASDSSISSNGNPFSAIGAEDEHAVPMNIVDTTKAYNLLLALPYEANVVNCLTSTIFHFIVIRLRQILQDTTTSSPPAALQVEKPEVGSKEDQMQLRLVNVFLILYACPLVTDPLYFESILPALCRATNSLPIHIQARICKTWASHAQSHTNTEGDGDPWLLELQRILMQSITLRCLTLEPQAASGGQVTSVPNEDKQIREAAKTLRIVYFASLIAGGLDGEAQLQREAAETAELEQQLRSTAPSRRPRKRSMHEDPLGACLGINPNDSRHPLIPGREFINETLNEYIEADRDFSYYRSNPSPSTKLSFMELPFLLQTTTKIVQLYYDNRLRMLNERRGAFLHSLLANDPEMPFFKLRVSRERIVEDALVVLEITWLENPGDLKKQLYVEFDGEQGIDEGGLSKEFFQLIIERIFNPDYGMFTYSDETKLFWFNPSPMEDLEREYCLIGCIVGLAIYNHIILDFCFPSLLYRKLVGKLGTVEDLKEGWPSLHHGLQEMLAFDGSEEEFQEVFCATFDASYTDVFGCHVTKELMLGGSQKKVCKSNRQEYADMTADFILNTSVKAQFAAFRKGFNMVVSDSLLSFLFSPHEIELLVCGSQEYDFSELERVTKYEGNYTKESPTICNFWSVVHSLSNEKKRKLLQFSTGSDRIPLGGMSKLTFVIARQGPDSDRLPTAHTCFNVLLLPDYSTKEKLEEKLTIALSNCKGFGMF